MVLQFEKFGKISENFSSKIKILTNYEKFKFGIELQMKIWRLRTSEKNLVRIREQMEELKRLLQIEENQLKWNWTNELPK